MTNETLETIKNRRSCRAYKPEQITDEELNAVQDGSLVMGNLMLAAASLGLGSCWINRAKEEFETEEGKALLRQWGIEGDWVGIGHCILGYPAADPKPAAPRKPDYIVKV